MSKSSLLEIIKARIHKNGPLSIADYMEFCLGHPECGYYMTRDPFGAQGDFTTAPEISQLFGEIVGAWLVDQWMQLGSPEKFNLIELGPGRGTLMADILRTAGVMPGFLQACQVHLVEMSPVLKSLQQQNLGTAPCPILWHKNIDNIPDEPTLIVANEFFDALPIHQYVFQNGAWHERVILIENNQLTFSTAPTDQHYGPATEGEIKETSPATEAIFTNLLHIVHKQGGSCVFIDYGYDQDAFGDTLQALRKHQFSEVLSTPGEQDLTAHVNFARLQELAVAADKGQAELVTQQQFLQQNGIDLRLNSLCRNKSAGICAKLRTGANRLLDPAQMGELFKVLTYSYLKV